MLYRIAIAVAVITWLAAGVATVRYLHGVEQRLAEAARV